MDKARATGLFAKACGSGEAKGCFVAGLNYANGEGVASNFVTAANYIRKALAIDPNLADARSTLELLEKMQREAK